LIAAQRLSSDLLGYPIKEISQVFSPAATSPEISDEESFDHDPS